MLQLKSPHYSLFLSIALLSVALISGCASTGTKVEQSAVQQIQKGVTTKDEVIALLGPPMTATLTGDGKEMLIWSYAQSRVKGATMVPVVGLFAGGTNTNLTTLQVVINEDKVVEDYLWNESNIETKAGS